MYDTNDTKTPSLIILNQLRASGEDSRNAAGLSGLFFRGIIKLNFYYDRRRHETTSK